MIKVSTHYSFDNPLGLGEIAFASTHRLAVGPPFVCRFVRRAEEAVSLPAVDWRFAEVLFVRAFLALVLGKAEFPVAHCDRQGCRM